MTLQEKYKEYFKIGAAVNARTAITDQELIVKHFNSITAENEMKFGDIVNKNGEYKLKPADIIYQVAKENNISMRGHNFVWHNQTPLHIFKESPEVVLEELEKHMLFMNERYGDLMTCWDVVNEAIEDKSDKYLRSGCWIDRLGEDYIRTVFKMARKSVTPGTELFYNDYNEYVPEKRDKIVRLIKDLNSDEKLVDGVGMQCHVNLYYPTLDLMRQAIEAYADLDLRIHITEMDLSYFEFNDRSNLKCPSAELEERHAKVYGEYFALFREYKEYIDNVTLWGVSDDYTWLDNFPVKNRKNWPMLFDVEGNPKESFHRVMDF